jgi:hypothetical protein
MIHAMNGMQVLDNLQPVNSPGSGIQHWGSSYFGPRYSTVEAGRSPQALLTEMSANETILPHFHGVIQFQIFPAGSGTMGRQEIRPLMVQYKDRHTAYGPLVAGPNGCTFIALRNRTGDSAPVYLGKPGYKEKLKPSKRRNWISRHIPLSTRPIMQYRKDVAWEPLYDAEKVIADELDAQIVRLGAGMKVLGPDPKIGNGYYVFVANGSLAREGSELPLWSVVYVDSSEAEFVIEAGQTGLEALVLQFPKDDD